MQQLSWTGLIHPADGQPAIDVDGFVRKKLNFNPESLFMPDDRRVHFAPSSELAQLTL